MTNTALTNFQFPHPDFPAEGHESHVYTLQFNESYLVSGSADKSIRIWDVETRRLIRPPLTRHTASVLCIQFDDQPGQDVIVSGGADSALIVWSFSSGEIIKELVDQHSESVLNLHFDNEYLVTASKDKMVRLWNRRASPSQNFPAYIQASIVTQDEVPEYTLLATLTGHAAAVNAVQLNRSTIVSGSGDHVIKVWNLQTGQVTQTFTNIHPRGITALQFNSRFIVFGSSDNTAQIFDRDEETVIARLTGHTNIVRTVQAIFNAHEQPVEVVTGGYDGRIIFWRKDPSSEEWQQYRQLFYLMDSDTMESQSQVDPCAHERVENDNRVFKLQYDGKKLICGGYRTIIEGWELD